EYLRPSQRSMFARAEQRRLAPDGEMVQPQRPLAVHGGFLDMHVHAEGTAVDLRCPDIHEVTDRFLDNAMPQGEAELDELLEQLGRLLLIVDALGHVETSLADECVVGRVTRTRIHGRADACTSQSWKCVGPRRGCMPGVSDPSSSSAPK